MKIFFAIIATAVGVSAFYPYLKDTFLLKTKPHAYTWLIWTITQGTAMVGLWYGGGGWGGLDLIVGTFLVATVFLFSLRYGTKNITRSDTVILMVALLAIVFWWRLHQPLLAVFVVSVIDVLGYIPSFRKSYRDPWSETLISWIAFAISGVFGLFALGAYNLLTVTYIAAIAVANLCLFLFCLSRRRFAPKPK